MVGEISSDSQPDFRKKSFHPNTPKDSCTARELTSIGGCKLVSSPITHFPFRTGGIPCEVCRNSPLLPGESLPRDNGHAENFPSAEVFLHNFTATYSIFTVKGKHISRAVRCCGGDIRPPLSELRIFQLPGGRLIFSIII